LHILLKTFVTIYDISQQMIACHVLISLLVLSEFIVVEYLFDFMRKERLSVENESDFRDAVGDIFVIWFIAIECKEVIHSYVNAAIIFFGLTIEKSILDTE